MDDMWYYAGDRSTDVSELFKPSWHFGNIYLSIITIPSAAPDSFTSVICQLLQSAIPFVECWVSFMNNMVIRHAFFLF